MQFFIELLQIALDNRKTLSKIPSEEDWQTVYRIANQQAVLGIIFTAIEKEKQNNGTAFLPMELFYEWMGSVLQTEAQNNRLNNAAEYLTKIFQNSGFRSCVLKGQGIARLYPLPERRMPGDIDLWVEGVRNKVLSFLEENSFGIGHVVIHHVDAQIIDGIISEIHFKPVYACNPYLHYRLQKFFKKNADAQFSNYDEELGFSNPTLSFNAVYILSHIYMHFLYEGIGLRQIVDYYYVLIHLSPSELELARMNIKKVGLYKFAGAITYILEEICGMDSSLLVAKTDKKRGSLLLDEIMKSGNFGKFDDRLSGRDEKDLINFNLVALKRQLRFFRYYPIDVLSIPFFKVGHWCWRICKGYL
jgi:hypothetical protein